MGKPVEDLESNVVENADSQEEESIDIGELSQASDDENAISWKIRDETKLMNRLGANAVLAMGNAEIKENLIRYGIISVEVYEDLEEVLKTTKTQKRRQRRRKVQLQMKQESILRNEVVSDIEEARDEEELELNEEKQRKASA